MVRVAENEPSSSAVVLPRDTVLWACGRTSAASRGPARRTLPAPSAEEERTSLKVTVAPGSAPSPEMVMDSPGATVDSETVRLSSLAGG